MSLSHHNADKPDVTMSYNVEVKTPNKSKVSLYGPDALPDMSNRSLLSMLKAKQLSSYSQHNQNKYIKINSTL